MATTRRMWIKPPTIWKPINPVAHKTNRTIIIVVIIRNYKYFELINALKTDFLEFNTAL